MSITQAPIYLIQWGPDNELDEVAAIEERFIELANTNDDELPEIARFRIHTANSAQFAQQLRTIISEWQNPQTLYFSCHGNLKHLSFDADSTVTLSFDELGRILEDGLVTDCGCLALGCCEGLNPDTPLLGHLPDKIHEVYGFTGKPRAIDVASLCVAILLDIDAISRQYRSANQRIFGSCPRGDDQIQNATRQADNAIEVISDNFEEQPARLVSSNEGISVRMLKRVDYEGVLIWQGQTITLPAPASVSQ